ncbi:MAG: ComF family protein [Patescibacteria group bacterium]|nr:ComF family protein [Patescibacteria group bacterium]
MNIKKYIIKIKTTCLDFLFPIKCLGCGQEGVWLCKQCFDKIHLKTNLHCPVCKKRSEQAQPCVTCQSQSFLDRLYIAGSYEDELLHKVIHYLKYQYIKDLAQPLAQLLINFINQHQTNFEQDIILIPIPLHKKRYHQREFNQSELICRHLQTEFKWLIRTDILFRKLHTASQMKLKKHQREKNIQGAFESKFKPELENKTLILVDDVATTGSTLQEAAKILKQTGFKNVWGLVLARG